MALFVTLFILPPNPVVLVFVPKPKVEAVEAGLANKLVPVPKPMVDVVAVPNPVGFEAPNSPPCRTNRSESRTKLSLKLNYRRGITHQVIDPERSSKISNVSRCEINSYTE